jgi:exodeoxyribonuclease VII small subunit
MTAKAKKTNFNSAYEELQRITNEFEDGSLDLEESIPKFKRALELSRLLKSRLNELENEVKTLKTESLEQNE